MGCAHHTQRFTQKFLYALRRRSPADGVPMDMGLGGKRLDVDAQNVAESLR